MKISTMQRHARLWQAKQTAKRIKWEARQAEKDRIKAEAKALKKFNAPLSSCTIPDSATAAQVLAIQKAHRIARERQGWLAAGGTPTAKEKAAMEAEQVAAYATLQRKLAADARREKRLEERLREITSPKLTPARLAKYFALAPETFAGLVVKPGGELEDARIYTKGRNYRVTLSGRSVWAKQAAGQIEDYWKNFST